ALGRAALSRRHPGPQRTERRHDVHHRAAVGPVRSGERVRDGDSASGARVLLVEDEPNMARTLAKILERKGYDVAMAANGQEALEEIGEGRVPRGGPRP